MIGTKVVQHGEKSVYVEESTGQIHIHSPSGEVKIIHPGDEEGMRFLREEMGKQFEAVINLLQRESTSTVLILNGDFIKGLRQAEAEGKANADLFHFYIGSQAGRCQWLGVLNGWDAPRACRGDIEANIEKLFAKKFLDARIAALVWGEGGSGKSTLLRRIALDSAAAGNRFNWWVEDLDDFLEFDAYTVAANAHQQHLIFIDDWYRNKPADGGRAFFQWLQEQPNALVLLGDRSQQAGYAEYLYGGAVFPLESAENKAVLEHIADVSPAHRAVMAEIMQEEQRYGNSPLSMVLYVASHLLKEQDPAQGFDLNDGVKPKFQKIIAKKLLDLENDERYRGLGKVLYLLAKIYVSPKMNYVVFPEDFFLKTAAFLSKNDTLLRRLRSERAYPEQVNSLVYKRSVYSKRLDRQFEFIHFNHDVLAEQGIVGAATVSPALESLLAFNLFDLEEMMGHLAGNAEPNGNLMVWRWCFLENKHWEKDLAVETLLTILNQGLSFVTGSVFFQVIQAITSFEDKKKICRFVLAQPDFFRLPDAIVSTSLKLLEREEAGKQAARNILAQPDFFRLPFQIVSTSLKLLEREEAGKQAARNILAQPDFFRLPFEIVSVSLKLLEREEVSKQAARHILAQPDFFRLPFQIVSTSLKLLEREEAGKEAARHILAQPDFFRLPFEIVSTSLKLLEREEAGKQAARHILAQPDFFRLPKEIVSTSLKLLEREEAGKQAARLILGKKSEVHTFLIFGALKNLLPVKSAADLELIKNVVREINTSLGHNRKDFDRLHYDLLYLPLFDLPEHRERVLNLIRFFKPELSRLLKYNIFRILNCYREYPGIPYFQEEIKSLCESILRHCVADLVHQYREHPRDLRFGHIKLALQHPDLLPQAKKSVASLKEYAGRNADFAQSAFFEWMKAWEANGYQAAPEDKVSEGDEPER